VPVWPVVDVALALENDVVPKFDSSVCMHRAAAAEVPTQIDGASTIHSADVMSTAEALTVLEDEVPRVVLERRSRTRLPCTVTRAETVSPGCTVRCADEATAGTISNHDEYFGCPDAEQSDSVPTCSSAGDVDA
jgi:hypothetical protein